MRFVSPSAYFIVATFLVIGHSFRVQPIVLAKEPTFVSVERRKGDETAYSPTARKLKLETTPPARLNLHRDDNDNGYVRPAWEILGAMIALFLYLWFRTEHGHDQFNYLSVLVQPLHR